MILPELCPHRLRLGLPTRRMGRTLRPTRPSWDPNQQLRPKQEGTQKVTETHRALIVHRQRHPQLHSHEAPEEIKSILHVACWLVQLTTCSILYTPTPNCKRFVVVVGCAYDVLKTMLMHGGFERGWRISAIGRASFSAPIVPNPRPLLRQRQRIWKRTAPAQQKQAPPGASFSIHSHGGHNLLVPHLHHLHTRCGVALASGRCVTGELGVALRVH